MTATVVCLRLASETTVPVTTATVRSGPIASGAFAA